MVARRPRSRSRSRRRRGRGLGLAGGDWKRNARKFFGSVGRVLSRGAKAALPVLASGLASGDPRQALRDAGMAGLKGAVGMGRRRRRRRTRKR